MATNNPRPANPATYYATCMACQRNGARCTRTNAPGLYTCLQHAAQPAAQWACQPPAAPVAPVAPPAPQAAPAPAAPAPAAPQPATGWGWGWGN